MPDAASFDFEPKGTRLGVLIFLLGYGGGGGFATFMVYRELATDTAAALPPYLQQALLLALYLAAGYFVLLYLILGAHRYRFFESTFRVFTWRGWREFAWAQVQRAGLTTYRANVELALVVGTRQVVSVPLTSFRRGASLLAFVKARVPVPIVATERQAALIADD